MSPKQQIITGGGGSVITAICCFTPVLPLILGGTALAGALAWADYVLIPALIAFLVLFGIGIWRHVTL